MAITGAKIFSVESGRSWAALAALGAAALFLIWMFVKNIFAMLDEWCTYNILTGVYVNFGVATLFTILITIVYLFIERSSDDNTMPSVQYRLKLRLATFYMWMYTGIFAAALPFVYLSHFSVPATGYLYCAADQAAPINFHRYHLWHELNVGQLAFGILTFFTVCSALLYEYYHEHEKRT